MTTEFDRIMAKVQRKADHEAMLDMLPTTVETLIQTGEALAHLIEALGGQVAALTQTLSIHQAQLETLTARVDALERAR